MAGLHSDRYGFDIRVPTGWVADEASGVAFFHSNETTTLVVSVGDRTGGVAVCGGGPCREVIVRTMDELGQVLPGADRT